MSGTFDAADLLTAEGQYRVVSSESDSGTNPEGFAYEIRSGSGTHVVNVAFFVVGRRGQR